MKRILLASAMLCGCAALPQHTAAATAADSIGVATAHISATVTARNAGSAQWFFAMAPDDVLPLLPANTRLDMLDYFNSGVRRASADAAGARAIVTESTASRLRFETGDTCRFELAVFAAGADTIVALVETIAYPMRDSRIRWFDASWRPLAQEPLATPRLADWLTREGSKRRDEAESALPFITAESVTDPEQGTVELRNTTGSYFPAAEQPDALRLTAGRLVYKLRGKRFELKK